MVFCVGKRAAKKTGSEKKRKSSRRRDETLGEKYVKQRTYKQRKKHEQSMAKKRECVVCYENQFDLKCPLYVVHGGAGYGWHKGCKHKVCHDCIKDEQLQVCKDHGRGQFVMGVGYEKPRDGYSDWVDGKQHLSKLTVPWRQLLVCKCPYCRQPFRKASLVGQPVIEWDNMVLWAADRDQEYAIPSLN